MLLFLEVFKVFSFKNSIQFIFSMRNEVDDYCSYITLL